MLARIGMLLAPDRDGRVGQQRAQLVGGRDGRVAVVSGSRTTNSSPP